MGVFLQIRVVNAAEFSTRLRNVVLDDYTPLWPYAAAPLRNEVAAMFATRGAEGAHGPWAPLSADYLDRKYRKYGGQPILVASGAMREAFQSDAAFKFEPRRMTYGPADARSAEIAFYHQSGFRTRLGTGKSSHRRGAEAGKKAFVEPRRIFDWTPEFPRVLSRVLAAGYTQIMRRRGYAIASRYGLDIGPGGARMLGMNPEALLAAFTGEEW